MEREGGGGGTLDAALTDLYRANGTVAYLASLPKCGFAMGFIAVSACWTSADSLLHRGGRVLLLGSCGCYSWGLAGAIDLIAISAWRISARPLFHSVSWGGLLYMDGRPCTLCI